MSETEKRLRSVERRGGRSPRASGVLAPLALGLCGLLGLSGIPGAGSTASAHPAGPQEGERASSRTDYRIEASLEGEAERITGEL